MRGAEPEPPAPSHPRIPGGAMRDPPPIKGPGRGGAQIPSEIATPSPSRDNRSPPDSPQSRRQALRAPRRAPAISAATLPPSLPPSGAEVPPRHGSGGGPGSLPEGGPGTGRHAFPSGEQAAPHGAEMPFFYCKINEFRRLLGSRERSGDAAGQLRKGEAGGAVRWGNK